MENGFSENPSPKISYFASHANSDQERNPKKGQLAGELQYFRKIFLDEFSEVVEKCGKLDGDCG